MTQAFNFIGPGTTIVLPEDLHWSTPAGAPPKSFESAALFGDSDNGQGPYVALLKWYPGWMSAPHQYLTDRLAVVLSGTWWVDSAGDFDPRRSRPVLPGTSVRRLAGTPHYDGVIAGAPEPAVIAMFGLAPIGLKIVDPTQPAVRKV